MATFNQAQYDDLKVKTQDVYANTKYDVLERWLGPARGLRILNAGCGSGELCWRLARLGHRVVGIDPEPSYVELARMHPWAVPGADCSFAVSSIETYSGHADFDCVISTDVLEHIADDRAAFAKMMALVKPAGRVLITVPAGQWLFGYHDEQLGHYRRYSKRTLVELVQPHCDVKAVRYFGATLIPVCLAYSRWLRKPYPVAETGDRSRRPLVSRILEGMLQIDGRVPLPLGTSLLLHAVKKSPSQAKGRRAA
jgi:SAM-dependent methyltransferase